MTEEQRNDLCIEWECTCHAVRQNIVNEYQKKHSHNTNWDNWEEFLIDKLNIRQFWQTVGLA